MSEVAVHQERSFLPQIDEKAIMELKRRYDMFRTLQKKVLEIDIDYGWPAGRRQGKPSLYKSGAEKLTQLFRLSAEFQIVKLIEEDDFIEYIFKCTLKTPSGLIVGEGYGAANSREKKHWKADPWANQNTILKMAKKRAHVDAVLTGLGASNVFTQDIEDMEDYEEMHHHSHTANESNGRISEAQMKKIHALIKEYAQALNKTPEEVKEAIKKDHGVEHMNELTKQQASEIINRLERFLSSKKLLV